MKKLQHIKAGLLVLIMLFSITGISAQDKAADKAAKVKAMIDARTYVFKVQTVLPMRGARPWQQQNMNYDVTVLPDTVISYLPYFGRAFTAPVDPSKGGIQFVSEDFEYDVTDRKKGGWDILIKPRDVQDVSQFRFSITESGFTSLQVTSNNRQPISFNGYITERKPRK